MASRSPQSKDKRSSTMSTSTSAPSHFLVTVLASIGRSDANDVGPFGRRVALADQQLRVLLAPESTVPMKRADGETSIGGVCDDQRLEMAVAAVEVAYEGAAELDRSYTRALARVNALERGEQPRTGDADAVVTVRYAERSAAFALGVALGLRMGGAR